MNRALRYVVQSSTQLLFGNFLHFKPYTVVMVTTIVNYCGVLCIVLSVLVQCEQYNEMCDLLTGTTRIGMPFHRLSILCGCVLNS